MYIILNKKNIYQRKIQNKTTCTHNYQNRKMRGWGGGFRFQGRKRTKWGPRARGAEGGAPRRGIDPAGGAGRRPRGPDTGAPVAPAGQSLHNAERDAPPATDFCRLSNGRWHRAGGGARAAT